jgi:hypothetical protein
MHHCARYLGAVLATLALVSSIRAQELAERDFLDGSMAVDSLVQPTRPTPPPLEPYLSPVSTFYVTTDIVGFMRSNAGGVFATNSTQQRLFTGDDLDFAAQPGLRTLLGVRLTDYVALEGTYLGLFEWSEQHSLRNGATNALGTTGNLMSPFTQFGQPATAGFDYNRYVEVSVESQFNSAEVNLRHFIDLPYSTVQASVIYGTRYMSVRDRLAYRSESAEPVAPGTAISVDVDTDNQMFGPQLGGALEMHVSPRGWLNLEAKGIMLYNDASQSTQFASGPLVGPAVPVFGTASDNRMSYAADVQATLSWKFAQKLVWRVGYQAIFIEGLALGSENFGTNALNASIDPSQLSKSGNIAIHGPFTGLTLTW